jgi:hypothetical protein
MSLVRATQAIGVEWLLKKWLPDQIVMKQNQGRATSCFDNQRFERRAAVEDYLAVPYV